MTAAQEYADAQDGPTIWEDHFYPEIIDPETGAILRTIECNRFVTGVTWVDGELWHGTWEGDESDLRRVDPKTGEVLERLEMLSDVAVSGLESDGDDLFFCGGGTSGKGACDGRPPDTGAICRSAGAGTRFGSVCGAGPLRSAMRLHR